MRVLVVNQAEVTELLPMAECIEVMTRALAALARGQALLPLRPVMWLPERVGALAMMPAYLGDIAMMGVKVISYFPGNRGTGHDSHQGPVLLFETTHGRLLAVLDATAITAIRTAAVSAVATKLLARPGAGDLAILGTGTQARTHLEAMRAVRDVRRVRVWSLTPANVRAFAERESARWGITVEAMPTAEAAVSGADLICTTTSAQAPVLRGEWLAPGAHVNAVGSSVPHTRELDTAAVARSRLFVDRRESALHEAGDFLFPRQEGAVGDDHILGEIGEVLLGRVAGRRSDAEVTLFKSLGLAVEDLAAAHHIYTQAAARGLGTSVEFGGSHHGSA
jgi:ornithine cyclodeaminase